MSQCASHVFGALIFCLDIHDIRAYREFQQGTDLKALQQVWRCAEFTLTLNTCSHKSRAMQAEAAAKVDELLTPISVSEELKSLREQQPSYVVSAAYRAQKPAI